MRLAGSSGSSAMLPSTVTRPVTIQEISIMLDPRDTKLDSGRELTNGNPSPLGSLYKQISQIVSFETEQARIMLESGLGAGDLRSRTLHVDLHAELHTIEKSRPADSAPHFARFARFSFIWRRPSPKNLKRSYSSRCKSAFWEESLKEESA